jgi:signal transduction histidine kinase
VSAAQETVPAMAQLRRARGQQELAQRWFRWLSPLLLVFFVLLAARGQPGAGTHGRGLVVSVAVAGFVLAGLGANATVLDRRRPLHIAFVVVLLASAIVLICVQPAGPGSGAALVGVLYVARQLPSRLAVPLVVAASAGLAIVAGIISLVSILVLAAIGGFLGMMYLALRLSEASKQAEQLLVRLEQSRQAEAQAAGLAERQRVAREMHDVLAHSLSGLMLQLEGARMLAEEDPADPQLPVAIEHAHRLGRSGLEEARRAIGMLRGDELPGPERLPGLVAQFQQDWGTPCRLTVTGQERQLGAEARLALYRVAQEALTNVAKHAAPARVELRLAYEPSVTRLIVEDFGPPGTATQAPAASVPGGGYGLTGMRERAALLGGALTAGTTPDGFRVELDVPA